MLLERFQRAWIWSNRDSKVRTESVIGGMSGVTRHFFLTNVNSSLTIPL
jgi:hypothetical protein